MAVTTPALAQEIARCWAQLVRDEPAVARMFVETRPHRIELYLVTHPTDDDTERRLYEKALELYDRFPDVPLLYGVLNAAWYENGDALVALPSSAVEVSLDPDH